MILKRGKLAGVGRAFLVRSGYLFLMKCQLMFKLQIIYLKCHELYLVVRNIYALLTSLWVVCKLYKIFKASALSAC